MGMKYILNDKLYLYEKINFDIVAQMYVMIVKEVQIVHYKRRKGTPYLLKPISHEICISTSTPLIELNKEKTSDEIKELLESNWESILVYAINKRQEEWITDYVGMIESLFAVYKSEAQLLEMFGISKEEFDRLEKPSGYSS